MHYRMLSPHPMMHWSEADCSGLYYRNALLRLFYLLVLVEDTLVHVGKTVGKVQWASRG
jgi:hypothetical protein